MLLGVNIDHIATLRQIRRVDYPNLIDAAEIAGHSGADSITIHLREDRRHIQDDDVNRLKDSIDKPINLEIGLNEEILEFTEKVKPAYCCLVPEKREELTTEGGLDVQKHYSRIKLFCQRLSQAGSRVSLFIDPEFDQIQYAQRTGAEAIELHTGDYANASSSEQASIALRKIINCSRMAKQLGFQVHAGHGLTYQNVQNIAKIPDITELNIGHSIICRAVFVGLADAVKQMRSLIDRSLIDQ